MYRGREPRVQLLRLRGRRDPRCAKRRPARARQPLHGHLLGDGRDDPAALPRLHARLLAAAVRRRGRAAAGRGGARPRRRRLRGRPHAPAQGGRGARLRALRLLASSACSFGNSVQALGAIVFLDRTGKGIRTAPARRADLALERRATARRRRSASTARSTRPARCSGPLIAFGLLWLAPRRVRRRSSSSASASALVGLGVLVLFVENRPVPARRRRPHVSLRAAARLLGTRRFATLVAVGARARARSRSATASSSSRSSATSTSSSGCCRCSSSAPRSPTCCWRSRSGRLADRFGPGRIFVAGYLPLLAAYALAAPAAGPARPRSRSTCCSSACYYAATDGVLMALASATLPADAARQRAGAARDGDEPRPVAGLGGLRHDLDMARTSRRRSRPSPSASCMAMVLAGGGAAAHRRRPRPLSSRAARISRSSLLTGGRRRGRRRLRRLGRARSDSTAAERRRPRGGAAARDRAEAVRRLPARRARTQHYARGRGRAVDAPAPAAFTGLVCERVYFAAGRGICLIAEAGAARQRGRRALFGADFRPRRRLRLDGIPSRARVSPSGRYGATTTFVPATRTSTRASRR